MISVFFSDCYGIMAVNKKDKTKNIRDILEHSIEYNDVYYL